MKRIDVRHDLVTDVRDAGEVIVVCVKTRTCSLSKSLDTQKFHKHARTLLNVV